MPVLPTCPASFLERKSKILSQLSVPSNDYTDASPKGSVDEGIRELIAELNAVDGIVTTSSCAGRVSVFAEGRKTADPDNDGQVAGVGGKGAGGKWLYVSHDPVPEGSEDWIDALELVDAPSPDTSTSSSTERRLIHFKFEPMILHILTASPSHAQLLLRCALEAGFRESGAINVAQQHHNDGTPTPLVAVRSMGLGFESLIGRLCDEDEARLRLVPAEYLRMLMDIATDRFAENAKRIARFLSAFRREFIDHTEPRTGRRNPEWEDPVARRERKRAEGLRRKAELEESKSHREASEDHHEEATAEQLGLPPGL